MALYPIRGSNRNKKSSIYENLFFERGKNLITMIIGELDEKLSLKVLKLIGCKIERGRIKEEDKIVMSLDYLCQGTSYHAIEQNIETGESRYIERCGKKGRRNKDINWEEKDPSKVSPQDAKEFNGIISDKIKYLNTDTMKQMIPKKSLDKLNCFLDAVYQN